MDAELHVQWFETGKGSRKFVCIYSAIRYSVICSSELDNTYQVNFTPTHCITLCGAIL